MKDSYLTAGIRFRPLVRLLRRNQITWTSTTILRILFLLQSSAWSSLFSRVERYRYGASLESAPVPRDPIFIIGHWRTGSTLLHQLLSQDPQLTVPTLFQVALPENFLVSYRFYQPILTQLMGSSRPMDNVRIGMDEPQEDEYAMFRLTTQSPLERLIFPEKQEYFLQNTPFLPKGVSLLDWENNLKNFYRKIQFHSGKQIVSKNPFNSLRILFLSRIFPDARFIHIVRHPYAVVPSTQHLWRVVQRQNILNRNLYTPDVSEVTEFLHSLTHTIHHDLATLNDSCYAEVRYEDLVAQPVGTLKQIYRQLGMIFSDDYEKLVTRYIDSLAGYTRNTYSLSNEHKKMIAGIMRHHMERFKYSENV